MAGESDPRTISVAGEGAASARPDRCAISVSLRALRDRVGDAIGAVATVADDAFRALRAAGLSDDDLVTTGLNVQPWTDRTTHEVTAHVATYSATVSVAGIERVPAIVDALSEATGDALQINHVVFSHSDAAPLVASARRAAVVDARARAEQLAGAAGVGLGALLEIREGTGGGGWRGVGLSGGAVMARAAAAMPVEPGDQTVRVGVVLTFAIDP